MSILIYEDNGIRFEYPADWEPELTDGGPRTTVAVQSPEGLAFALVTLDETCPPPAELADEALEAMSEEYPDLEATPATEVIGGHRAVGHDLGFFSLDVFTSCAIRCFRTPRRTVLVFVQWSDLEGDDLAAQLVALRGSLNETDAGDAG
ncbi:MAG: hypothetical protein ABI353_14340 [Isosphaeraceae bacterium]